MPNRSTLLVGMALVLTSCIGTDILDDEVEPVIIILNPITELEIGTTYPFMAEYRNRVGMPEDVPLMWDSSDERVIAIDEGGNASAFTEGEVELRVTGAGVTNMFLVTAGDRTSAPLLERTANLVTSSTYPLEGTATLTETEEGLVLRFKDNFVTTSALPGLYVYLSNNTTTTNNAYEVGKVTAFSGAQEYLITDLNDLTEYRYVLFFCKPFVVPVGHGELNP